MRHRMPSPVRPFDLAPPHVVEAAKRLFSHLRRNGMGGQMRLKARPYGPAPALDLGPARLPAALPLDLRE
jgi:hypothetical protein